MGNQRTDRKIRELPKETVRIGPDAHTEVSVEGFQVVPVRGQYDLLPLRVDTDPDLAVMRGGYKGNDGGTARPILVSLARNILEHTEPAGIYGFHLLVHTNLCFYCDLGDNTKPREEND